MIKHYKFQTNCMLFTCIRPHIFVCVCVFVRCSSWFSFGNVHGPRPRFHEHAPLKRSLEGNPETTSIAYAHGTALALMRQV